MNGRPGQVMDDIDRRLLELLQEEFPVIEEPFIAISQKMGIAEDEVISRIERLKAAGYIRRIGPVLDAKKLGYRSLLCAASAGADIIEGLARAISAEPSVTHNYEREDTLNIWFTVTMKTRDDIDAFLKAIEEKFSIVIHRFPEKKTFKIRTRFITGNSD